MVFISSVTSTSKSPASDDGGGRYPAHRKDVIHRTSKNGAPVLDGAVAWVDCGLYAVQDAGDHDFVLGEVKAMTAERTVSPLIFHRGAYGQISATKIGAENERL